MTPGGRSETAVPATPLVHLGAEGDRLPQEAMLMDAKEELRWPDDGEVVDLVDDVNLDVQSSDSGSSDDESSASSDEWEEVQDVEAPPVLPCQAQKFSDEPVYYINVKSLVIHSLRESGKFKCGRVLNQTYSRIRELNGFRCGKCFVT